MRRVRQLLFACALLLPAMATAGNWQGKQGEVMRLEIESQDRITALKALGKQWPVKQAREGRWVGWIGIDLKQKPGSFDILWRSGKRTIAKERLDVTEGKFRISHIKVKKKMAQFDKKTLARIRREVKALKAAYVMPVKAEPEIVMQDRPVEGVVSTPFGAQRYVNGEPRSPHSGLDIAAPAGTPIKAPLSGRVLFVAEMYLNGNTVVLGHGNGLVSVYCHMQSIAVKKGEWVDTHQLVGKVGSTGRSTGPHLHWGVRFNNARVDPDSLL